MNKILSLFSALTVAGFVSTAPALAQDIKIPNIIEMSGAGATVGANWKNGVEMAIAEINAAGGILGKKVTIDVVDTQSIRQHVDDGVRGQHGPRQREAKAIPGHRVDEPRRIPGQDHSGSASRARIDGHRTEDLRLADERRAGEAR